MLGAKKNIHPFLTFSILNEQRIFFVSQTMAAEDITEEEVKL